MNHRKTVQILAAQDWYFIHEGATPDTPIVHVIAAWALNDLGEVNALIGGVETGPGTPSEHNRLVKAPPIKGTCKHLSDLTAQERKSLNLPPKP